MKNLTAEKYDIIVGGAGIVGCATALELIKKFPQKKILLIDKENSIAVHQTGNNSGVIHSGIYYKPNSLKSTNCINGYHYLIEFCKEHNIPVRLSGKIIAARNNQEDETLDLLFERSKEVNLVGIKKLDSHSEITKIEPNLNVKKGLYVPQTGVVNYKTISTKMVSLFKQLGGTCILSAEILNYSENKLGTNRGFFQFEKLILCTGLQSDRLKKTKYSIIPFRGEYFKLDDTLNGLVNSMVYPAPDLRFPFLGLHFTKGIDQQVEIGPNALLALARERYKNKFQFDLKDSIDLFSNWNLYKFIYNNKSFAKQEILRSLLKNQMKNEIQSYFPQIEINHFSYCRSGIRAQVMDDKGDLVDDFIIEKEHNCIHILNAPSPAATSSIAIAKQIVKLL